MTKFESLKIGKMKNLKSTNFSTIWIIEDVKVWKFRSLKLRDLEDLQEFENVNYMSEKMKEYSEITNIANDYQRKRCIYYLINY